MIGVAAKTAIALTNSAAVSETATREKDWMAGMMETPLMSAA
jgi:hypothetical protein